MAAQVRTDPNKPPELGELVTLPNTKKEGTSWLLNFPAKPITNVWLIKAGVGFEVSVGLKAAYRTGDGCGHSLGYWLIANVNPLKKNGVRYRKRSQVELTGVAWGLSSGLGLTCYTGWEDGGRVLRLTEQPLSSSCLIALGRAQHDAAKPDAIKGSARQGKTAGDGGDGHRDPARGGGDRGEAGAAGVGVGELGL